MIIQAVLEAEHSKTSTLRILGYIGDDPMRMQELMDCFFSDNLRLCQRAAWAVGYIGARQPLLIEPYLGQMLARLDNPPHEAIVRNTFRTLRDMPEISESILGQVIEHCFRLISTPTTQLKTVSAGRVASRVFSLRILEKISRTIPELKEELRLTIEDVLFYEDSKAFVAAAKDVLKNLSK
jgi:hypothetical protein